MEIGIFLDRLDKVKKTAKGTWVACCHNHADRDPSLSIRQTNDGRTGGNRVTPKTVHSNFKRERLPRPAGYYQEQGLKLTGTGTWKLALCPFHDDTNPSLGVNIDSGGFLCHACGARGGNVLDFHKLRHGLGFVDAAKALGAWEGKW